MVIAIAFYILLVFGLIASVMVPVGLFFWIGEKTGVNNTETEGWGGLLLLFVFCSWLAYAFLTATTHHLLPLI